MSPIFLILLLVTSLAYSNTLTSPFVYDDLTFIVNNPSLREPLSVESVVNASYGQRTRFVGFLTFFLNYRLHGLDVVGYHLVNIFIHITNAFLVWFLIGVVVSSLPLTLSPSPFPSPRAGEGRVRGRGKGEGAWLAFFTAFLFAVHPVQTQAVTYISQRVASLATMFYLGALCLYAWARLKDIKTTARIFCFLGAAVLGLLGIFTKEIVVTLPLAIVLLEWFFVRNARAANTHQTPLKGFPILKWGIYLSIFLLAAFIVMKVFSFDRVRAALWEPIPSQSHPGDTFPSGLLP